MHIARLLLIVLLAAAVTGCSVITGIFKTGFWAGVIAVVLVIILAGWIATKLRRR